MTTPFVYDGAMHGNVLRAHVERVLAPPRASGNVAITACASGTTERGGKALASPP